MESLYPRGGLLGGNPNSGGPKVSKLAALAASRKRKENEPNASSGASSSVALLDKLGHKKASDQAKSDDIAGPIEKAEIDERRLSKLTSNIPIRSYTSRRRQSPIPPKEQPKPEEQIEKRAEEIAKPEQIHALPSSFAATLLGPRTHRHRPSAAATSSPNSLNSMLNFTFQLAEPNAFSGPSPDDIVAKAQSSSKGAKRKAKKKDREESD